MTTGTTRNLTRQISSCLWSGTRWTQLARSRYPTPKPCSTQTTRRNYAVYKRFDHPSLIPAPSAHPHPNGYSRFDQDSLNRLFNAFPVWFWVLLASSGCYYLVHLERVPQTGRWRFMDTSLESEIATGEQIYIETLKKFRAKLLPSHHPTSQFITRVAKKIIVAASSRIEHASDSFMLDHGDVTTDWKIHVIDEPRIQNAFVIPGGKIFVFTGILPICKNESGLATVLGHEVAHQVLRHPAERMSSLKIIFFLTGFLTILGLDPAICRTFITLLMTLPNSRTSEMEADQVGLNIMASACYDPKEAIGVWKRMEKNESNAMHNMTEFLQTHPTHDRRIQKIVSWLPEAQNQRERNCGFTSRSFNEWQL